MLGTVDMQGSQLASWAGGSAVSWVDSHSGSKEHFWQGHAGSGQAGFLAGALQVLGEWGLPLYWALSLMSLTLHDLKTRWGSG